MNDKMTCNEIRELLSPYIDNVLDEEQMHAVSEHLKHCDACWQEYSELYNLTKILEDLPELVLPESFDEKLRAAIALESIHDADGDDNKVIPLRANKKAGWKRLSSIAAIFVIGIFTLIMYNNSGDLIDNNDLGTENDVASNSSITQEETSFETDESFVGKKYASAAGLDGYNYNEAFNSDNDVETDDDELSVSDTADTQSNGDKGSASRSGVNENGKTTTTPEGTMLLRSALTDGGEEQLIIESADLPSEYLQMLDDELAEMVYEIVDSVQDEENVWSFQVKVTITDDEGKETIQDRTYIGQDGTLTWKKD